MHVFVAKSDKHFNRDELSIEVFVWFCSLNKATKLPCTRNDLRASSVDTNTFRH